MANIMEKLRAPFPTSEIEWRVGNKINGGAKGAMFPYVSARGIQDRLDDVFGVAGWTAEYRSIDKGIICKLTCTTEAGNVIVKEDGSSLTEVEAIKGGISSALKRAASVLGIGRYLYDLPRVVVELDDGKYFNGKIFLPDWAVPDDEKKGLKDVNVEYSSGHKKKSTSNKPMTPEIKAAMDVVITVDRYNAGRKMGEVTEKSLSFLVKGAATDEEKEAAKIVLDYKS